MKVAIGIMIITLILFGIVYPYATADTAVIKVTDKERVMKKSGDDVSSKYLIFTETETFENVDCLWVFKFNSSDVYGRLKKDHSYAVSVYGWRIPFLSQYRNIRKIQYEVTNEVR